MRACWDLDSATTHEAALAMHWHFVREVSHAFSVHFALMRSRVVRVDLTEQVLQEHLACAARTSAGLRLVPFIHGATLAVATWNGRFGAFDAAKVSRKSHV